MSSTADWLRGFEAGAHAAYHGEIQARLMGYWFKRKGLIFVPGGTEVKQWDMEEWRLYADQMRQRCTGHNRLGSEW